MSGSGLDNRPNQLQRLGFSRMLNHGSYHWSAAPIRIGSGLLLCMRKLIACGLIAFGALLLERRI